MANDRYVDRMEVFKSENGWWHYRAKSDNGEILFTSEGFNNKDYTVRIAEGLAADLGVKVKTL